MPRTVLRFKDGKLRSKDFHGFQFRLYDGLRKLSRLHYDLHAERRRHLARRSRPATPSYANRLKLIDFRLKTLVSAINAGRGLGDAFVWFFYRDEPELMKRHREQPSPSLPPPLDGGEGELALVGGVRFFDNWFILFHGITTLFRLGDASLLDLPTKRIVGIGELKTTRIDPKRLNLHFVVTLDADAAPKSIAKSGERAAPSLDAKRQASRQTVGYDQQGGSRRPQAAAHETGASVRQHVAHVKEVGDLVNATRPGRPMLRQFSPGLLVLAITFRIRTMRARLMAPAGSQRLPEIPELPELTKNLTLAGSAHNCIIMSNIFYREDWDPFLESGATPMLMWPEDSTALRSIATGRVTVFNPAHILEELPKHGVSIASFKPPHHLALVQERDGKQLKLERAEYFLRLPYLSLYSERYVIHTIVQTCQRFPDQDGPAKIDLTMSHRVFF